MRQAQSHQNKNRSRGRGGRNKGGNQNNRSLESNGPDVRIRGTAAHIAEKYTQLARDAQTASTSDLVAAENYLQHAEHYNRLIAAQQAAQQAQRENGRDDNRRQPNEADNERDSRNSDRDQARSSEDQLNAATSVSDGPQPTIEGVPAEVALKQPQMNSPVENAENGDKPAEPRRRTRRAPRRPRKEAAVSDAPANSDAAAEPSGELPAFIVGASEG